MTKVKLMAIGNSLGVVLPKEILNKLKVDKGDTLYLVESKTGLTLTPYDPEFEKQLESAKTIMKKYRNALDSLAK